MPSGLELPALALGLIPLACPLLLVFVAVRLSRLRPVPASGYAFVALALAGGGLQLTERWWSRSLPGLIAMVVVTLAFAIEVVARAAVGRHGPTLGAIVAIDAGAYFYLVAVLAEFS